jgi:hypothetical protein
MLSKLPQPTTFEQGQRKMFGLLLVGSGMFAGISALGMVVFMATLAFKFTQERLVIVYILGGALFAYLVLQSIVMISMSIGGPVGRFKVSANKEGAAFEATGDDEPAQPVVTTTTEVVMPQSGVA